MQEIVHAIFHRRHHFWKKVKFNELSELYMSFSLRVLGLGLIGIFIPIYLWQQGYPLQDVVLFFAVYYGLRFVTDPLTGKAISRFGPKHLIRISYLFEIILLIYIIAVGNHLAPLWGAPVLWAIAGSTFFIPFHVDFSNLRSAKHIGRQLTAMAVLEKIAGVLGPLAGGLIATLYSFEVAVIVALVVTVIAAIPMFLTDEEGKMKDYNYKFSPKNYTDLGDDVLPYVGFGADTTVYGFFWPFFTAIVIFGSEVYAGIGFITALGLGASLLSAHIIGKLVDNKKGRQLYRVGTGLVSALHLTRPFVSSIPGAAALNLASEPAASSVYMPMIKGAYYNANHYKHGRVAYNISFIGTLHLTRVILYLLFYIFLLYVEPQPALAFILFIAGLVSLLKFGERFKALDN